MFSKNDEHRQQSFFSGVELLPKRLREQLLNSWAETFYQEVFCRIDEEIFAVLYSDEASRPNVPVNVLVGMEILKVGFGWSDEELYEQVCFSLQVRHALGLHDLRAELFTLRTLYNFRKRVRLHAETEGINLMQRVFEQVTDAQLEAVTLETGWQRMDSTQVLSNLAEMTRLELLISVVQTAYRQFAMRDDQQAQWEERLRPYVSERPHNICYKIPADETEEHLTAIGELLVALEAELEQRAPESDALALVRRVLNEQYTRASDGIVVLRPAEDISATSLQSPHDPDATYRIKGGEAYPGGYVVNISETADPENPVQLITDVQTEPNQTDDSDLLASSLDTQATRDISIEKMTIDGGYTGPTAEAACEQHDVDLRATRMRGGKSAPDTWGWEQYEWELDDDGTPIVVTCPEGQTAELQPGQADDRLIARFDPELCAACPFFETKCRVQPRTRRGPTLYLQKRTVAVALQRQQLCPDDASIRAVIEATVRSLKLPFPNGKLPVRGLIRARMVIYASALMVNLRRLHTCFTEQANNAAQNATLSALLSFLLLIRVQCIRVHRYLSVFSVVVGSTPTTSPIQSN